MTQRVLDLDGGLNFRDLGGYESADGRSVRWHTLFRSGTTHGMTSVDISQLEARRIRFAYDLRSNSERREYPSRLTDIRDLHYESRDHEHVSGDIRRLLNSREAVPEQSRALMMSLYRGLPADFSDAFRSLFGHLAEGNLPLVFNCTAGKDRTGVAAALVLSTLGVPRQTILEDYMLTTQFFDQTCRLVLDDPRSTLFAGTDRSVWEPLIRVHVDYLNAMFAEVDRAHGSVDGYVRQHLGMDESAVEQMRNHLLE